jgi:hypothetical protein
VTHHQALENPSDIALANAKKKLQTASSTWMKQFLGLGGMERLLALLKLLGSRSTRRTRKQSRRCHSATSVHVALQQLQCVACVKAVANSAGGLKFIAGDDKHVGLFAESEQLILFYHIQKVQRMTYSFTILHFYNRK